MHIIHCQFYGELLERLRGSSIFFNLFPPETPFWYNKKHLKTFVRRNVYWQKIEIDGFSSLFKLKIYNYFQINAHQKCKKKTGSI